MIGGVKNTVMRILIDTNILIDFIVMRQPFYTDARRILLACDKKVLSGCMSAQAIPDIFYILRKDVSESDRRNILKRFCTILYVENLDRYKLLDALEDDSFKDFEDCLQFQCARSFHADYIITRNEKDPCINPGAFCKQYSGILTGMESTKDGEINA